jgi:hypothetical protein
MRDLRAVTVIGENARREFGVLFSAGADEDG